VRSSSLRTLVALVAIVPGVVLAACGGSAPAAAPTYPPGAIVVTADSRTFDTSQLVVPADTTFTLVFVNKEADQHNIAIRTKAGFEGDLVFRFDPISVSTVTLEVGPIAAGTYYFLCEVHPTMTGTVLSQ
jgi:plastocyanin